MDTYHVGLKWDTYTPAVEAQIVRDMMALQGQHANIAAVIDDPSPSKMLQALGVKPVLNIHALATLWVVYRTKDEPFEVPEHAEQVIERDLFSPEPKGMLNEGPHFGYYLKEQGRQGNGQLPTNRSAPTSVGQTDPAIVYLWS